MGGRSDGPRHTNKGNVMDTTTVDLKPFCGTSGPRYQVDQPWLSGDWIYATDTRIAVRIPHRLGIELGPDVTEFKRPDMEKLAGNPFGQFPLVDAVPLPVPKAVKCEACGGSGKQSDDMGRVPMLGVGIATCYYRKIRALGDVTCKVYGQMVLFQCGELQGVVMIMHP